MSEQFKERERQTDRPDSHFTGTPTEIPQNCQPCQPTLIVITEEYISLLFKSLL